ncbi:pentatricopeptide repeat-containing protein At4g04370 [Cornus florida]|uniref:pentatricopeptide repeat-containing protein At4g04370 n=1 Tax=Cornus florida TaxID=4283 RepID=UPI002899ED35|nr:pentatricopeptide repeat-containing protein At4g04370 [Cornus florida]
MNKLKPHFFTTPKPRVPPPEPIITTTTKSFNAIINRLSSEGAHSDVLQSYSSMFKHNTPPDAYTFPSVLKACTSLNLHSHGLCFHQHIIVYGYSSDAYIASSLIDFYAKFGHTHHARQVFEMMSERNIVPWTAVIGCYSRVGDINTAFWMVNRMRHEGTQPSSVTMLSLLYGVSEDTQVQCLHALTIQYGFGFNTALVNSVLNVYCKCGRIEDARDLFELMDTRDIVSWNSLISGYAQVGDGREILQLLHRMRVERMEPDQQTFGSLVSASARESNLEMGKLVHGQILTSGFDLDSHVETSLIVMYLKCGNLDDAYRIFERTLVKDVILWTAMISGLAQNECADKALTVFRWMLISRVMPSTATIASVLSACAQLGSFFLGSSIHGYILRQRMAVDIPTQNALVTMYAKCGHLDQSCAAFDMMEERDVVSWNAVVSGYAQNGHLFKAFYLFNKMMTSLQKPDSITVVSLLQACASIGALQQGKWIHNFVTRSCLRPCILIDTALVDMYSKCGDLDTARKCFDRMSQYDLISWSTIIAGYGSHGKGQIALEMYFEFLHTGLEPNHVILLSVLSACSHNGLVNQGLSLFHSMTKDFGIEPKLEHRACIVDLFSRAGRVEDAYDFYKRMFPEPAVDVLGILLDACRASGNVKLGDIIARDICMLKPVDAGNYLQLAHSYASMARWDSVGEAWIQMRSLGLKKLPGWSFIELHGTITTFFMDQSSHPQYDDILFVLKLLSKETKNFGINSIISQFHII